VTAVGLRAALAGVAPPGPGPLSVGAVLDRLRFGRPASLRGLVAGIEPVTLSFPLDDGTCAGTCQLVASPDGRVVFTGHVHNSGGLDARYGVIASVPMNAGPVLLPHQGTVGGTFGLDPRDEDWRADGVSRFIADDWAGFRAGTARARADFGTHTGAFEVFTSFVGAGTGEWVFTL
jgi:hypothetical protein